MGEWEGHSAGRGEADEALMKFLGTLKSRWQSVLFSDSLV